LQLAYHSGTAKINLKQGVGRLISGRRASGDRARQRAAEAPQFKWTPETLADLGPLQGCLNGIIRRTFTLDVMTEAPHMPPLPLWAKFKTRNCPQSVASDSSRKSGPPSHAFEEIIERADDSLYCQTHALRRVGRPELAHKVRQIRVG